MSNEINKVNPKWLNKAEYWYVKNPSVRALMQLLAIPTLNVSTTLDVYLVTSIQNMKEKRLRGFFEELDKGAAELTEEILQSEDFLHAFFATKKASLNTRRKEKIKMFAKMLSYYVAKYSNIDIDDYEENLNILDELSIREFRAMVLYEEYFNKAEESFRGEDKKDAANIVNTFWSEYLAHLANEFNVSEDEIQATLVRLQRTGCYRLFASLYGGNPDSRGCLTKKYLNLKRFVSQK